MSLAALFERQTAAWMCAFFFSFVIYHAVCVRVCVLMQISYPVSFLWRVLADPC